MKLINPSFEIYEQGPGIDGIYEAIERAGRTCYKSTRPEGQTAKDFVDRMIASKHYAMLEHGTVYLTWLDEGADYHMYEDNPYSKVQYELVHGEERVFHVTTNLRVLVENGWLEDLQYLHKPTKFHERRVTVRFTTDRGVSHEFVRHRVFSFAQESTRYCNYSKDKFGKELTFIIPSWLNMKGGTCTRGADTDYFLIQGEEKVYLKDSGWDWAMFNFVENLELTSKAYFMLLERGWTPQQARQVLPNALKTELVMTGFVSDWEHFFDLRARGTTGAPHPDAKALAEPLMGEFYKRNLIQ